MSGRSWAESLAIRAGEENASASRMARSLWAKSGDGVNWLDLPQHLVDSACVGAWLWERWVSPQVQKWLALRLKLPESDVGRLVAWLASAHDLGKATSAFQRKLEKVPGMEEFSDRISTAGLPLAHSKNTDGLASTPHSVLSKEIQRRWLLQQGINRDVVNGLVQVGEAHHGRTSSFSVGEAAVDIIDEASREWRQVQEELADMVASITEVLPVLRSMSKRPVASELQVLTGLIVMADWLASNEFAFPLRCDFDQLPRVEVAMDGVTLTTPWNPTLPDTADVDEYYRASFEWPARFAARPVQVGAIEAALEASGPVLLIIEAPTGEGKTEAGLAAGHVLAARTGSQGLMFAAPTMSTANGLFRRVTDWARVVTPSDEISSMFLAHSKSALSEGFRSLKLGNIGEPADEEIGNVVATQWLAGPKKGLLANFVVGTVDQVLMLALQMKHSMLRHLGLSGKVIIIDEAHSFDFYMNEYMGTALAWLARYGVSVILMSATLPLETKDALARAYASQLTRAEITATSMGYPLVTSVSARGIVEKPLELGPPQAHLRVKIIGDDLEETEQLLVEKLSDGGIALVICNTVRRAQQTYERLAALFPGDVELHHAAFMAHQRAAKEEELRLKLGPHAHKGSGRPSRRIIVSTQIAEQSLDIDADLLITDIAPMDLWIQRTGRIQRHARPQTDRPAKVQTPQVYIRGILAREPVPEFEAGSEYIYGRKLLLATLAVLERDHLASGFERPADIAPAVHSAYAAAPPIPDEWQEAWEQAVQEFQAEALSSKARAKSFRIPEPGTAENLDGLFARYVDPKDTTGTGEERGSAQVRDSATSIEVIPIIGDEYGYRVFGADIDARLGYDDVPDYGRAFELASATVRLPARFSKEDWKFQKTISQLELETPLGWRGHYLLKGQVALVLGENGATELAGDLIRYTEELGLEQVFDKCAEDVQRDG